KRSLLVGWIWTNVFSFDVQIAAVYKDEPLCALRFCVYVVRLCFRNVTSFCFEIETPLQIVSATVCSPAQVKRIDKCECECAARHQYLLELGDKLEHVSLTRVGED